MQAMSIRTQQRKHIRKRMRLILIYAVFLLLFTYHQVTSTNDDDYFNFSNLVKKSITEELFQPSLSQSAWHQQLKYADIANVTHLYQWLEGPFVNTLDTLDSKVAILGGVRIGQLRSKTRDCSIDAQDWGWFAKGSTQGLVCPAEGRGHFSTETESRQNFGNDAQPFEWRGWNNTDTASERKSLYAYDESRNNYWITLPSPGFSVVLPPRDIERTKKLIRFLQNNTYIDFETKAVMLDLSVVNIMLNRIVFLRFTIEFSSSGGALPFLKQMEATPHVLPQTTSEIFLTSALWFFILYFSYDAACDIKALGWTILGNKTLLLLHLNVFL
jgi:hypothetical protein